MSKRVAFHTLGCKLNYSETSSISADFVARGYQVVPLGAEAELIVINTCTVTENADAECRKIVRRGLKGAPDAAVVVTGCYAQLQPEDVASIDGVRAVFGTAEKSGIADLADEILSWDTPQIHTSDLSEDTSFVGSATAEGDSRTRAFLKLQDGCDYTCTFCTIPLARGPARAMEFERIAEAIDGLVRDGFHEIVLSGINLGEYKAPSGERFADVVRLIDVLQPPVRVRISSIEPNTLSNEIIDLVANSTVFVPHFHVPLQSGSVEILKRMRRRYNPEKYQQVAQRIFERMPHAALGIDVIVGFPGETDDLFEESWRFLESIPFTYLHVFTYSERENTPAASYADVVPMSVRKARTARLRAFSEQRRAEHHARNVGSTRIVIPETFDAQSGTWSGWTENYVRVAMHAPELIVRGPHRVALTEVHADVVAATSLGHVARTPQVQV